MVSTGFMMQEVDPGGTTLIDAYNGFNEVARFTFNCYKN